MDSEEIKSKTCCCFGHRKIKITDKLCESLISLFTDLIINEGVEIFLFGSRGEFNDFCYKVITKLKNKFSQIRRIYVRAE